MNARMKFVWIVACKCAHKRDHGSHVDHKLDCEIFNTCMRACIHTRAYAVTNVCRARRLKNGDEVHGEFVDGKIHGGGKYYSKDGSGDIMYISLR